MRLRQRTAFYHLFLVAAVFVVLGVIAPSAAQSQTPAPLEVIHKRDMKFGTFAADADLPGTVILSPDADITTLTGGLVDFGGTIRRARFQITGEPRAYVFISLPTSMTIRKGTSGNTMTIDSFVMDRANPIRLSAQGKRTINIGATLRVSVDQKKGNYNDDNAFIISADYQ